MMTLPTVYGEYGNHQQAFSYLSSESQAEIVNYCHAIALMMDEARDSVVVAVMSSGPITQGEMWREMVATIQHQHNTPKTYPVGYYPHGIAEMGY